jgi:hypothetical protein
MTGVNDPMLEEHRELKLLLQYFWKTQSSIIWLLATETHTHPYAKYIHNSLPRSLNLIPLSHQLQHLSTILKTCAKSDKLTASAHFHSKREKIRGTQSLYGHNSFEIQPDTILRLCLILLLRNGFLCSWFFLWLLVLFSELSFIFCSLNLQVNSFLSLHSSSKHSLFCIVLVLFSPNWQWFH